MSPPYISTDAVSFDDLKDGSEMIRVPITVSGPNPEVELKRHETVEIQIRYRVEFPGPQLYWIESRKEVIELLTAILDEEWSIFEVFVNEFR
jgi:hypothetical protein